MAEFNVSTSKSQENNQFFMAFKDSGFSPTLILPALLLCLIASAGIFLNSFVVFVTIKTKTLHNPTNFLLAFLSSFEILHQIGHFPFLFIVITGINFVPILTAFWILLIPLFSLNAALMAMTCTALDRVVAILVDIIREKMGILAYMGLHLALIALYGLHSCQYFYKFVMDNSFVWVTGCITEMMIGESGKIFFVHTAALCSIASICYLVVWIFVRTKSFASHETHSRLFKSLVIILLVNIGGYIVNLFFLQVLLFILETQYSADQTHLWLISFISAFLMNGCVASNAFILYANSSDYRSAFKKYLEIISTFRHKSTVNPLISVSHPQNNSRTLPQIQ